MDARAAALLSSPPSAGWLLADLGYNADRFREELKDKWIDPYIPERKPRAKPTRNDNCRYKCRNRIEITFGRLKVWRRIAN